MDDPYRATLIHEVNAERAADERRNIRWSIAYHATLYGNIVLAGLAALLPKLDVLNDVPWRSDVASIFAATAAILAALMHVGAFERRWRAARTRQARAGELYIQSLNPNADTSDISNSLRLIIASYNKEVLGDSPEVLKN
jgi:hypothetical protein